MIAAIYLCLTVFLAIKTNSMLLHANAELTGNDFDRADWILFIVYALLYGGAKVYAVVWEDITISRKKMGVGLFLYEKFIFPSAWLYLIKGKLPISSIISQPDLLTMMIVLFIILGDWVGLVKGTVRHWYPGVSELESGKLFLTYPPTSRLDMIPIDLYFNGILAIIIWRQMF
jgi:hypothetical protein